MQEMKERKNLHFFKVASFSLCCINTCLYLLNASLRSWSAMSYKEEQ